MQSADTATSSDTERRLPSNAHRQPSPQSIRRDSASIARATDRLASTPPSLPRSLHLEEAMDKSVAARRLRRHLVTRPQTDADDGYNGDTNDNEDDVDDGASATGTNMPVDPLTLPSGDVTYGIYRWHQTHGESDDRSAGRRRRGSFSGAPSDGEWGVPYTQRQIAAPGGFRRQFVQERALQQGRAANILTENFVDFIGLYGHFAGEDYPSDEDDDDAEQEVGEQAPLLRQPSMRSLQATASNKKAFFLLLKAFVGTGVLVLPKAFSNGGLLASIVMMLFVAWYAWHCMVILGDVYLHVGGSYSELGAKLFGRWASRIITVSVLLAQIGFCSAYTIF
ncbi:hypothetical protein FB639_003327, partial [Coemansia asiatica]